MTNNHTTELNKRTLHRLCEKEKVHALQAHMVVHLMIHLKIHPAKYTESFQKKRKKKERERGKGSIEGKTSRQIEKDFYIRTQPDDQPPARGMEKKEEKKTPIEHHFTTSFE